MKHFKPEVGQTLYSLDVSYVTRPDGAKLSEVRVTKVGRKYFSCNPIEYLDRPHLARQYHLDDWREKSDYSVRTLLYTDPSVWEQEKEVNALYAYARLAFGGYSPSEQHTLEKLREIKAILIRE